MENRKFRNMSSHRNQTKNKKVMENRKFRNMSSLTRL